MRLNYNVKIPLNNKYEMHSMSWEFHDSDLPAAALKLSREGQMQVLQYMALRQAALFQLAKGYVTREAGAELIRQASLVLPSSVREEVLKDEGGS